MEQSWSCQTTKQFKLQTLGTFLFVAATNSQQPKVFLGRAVGKRTTFELFLFYYEFFGATSWILHFTTGRLAIPYTPRGRESCLSIAAGTQGV